MPRHKRSTFGTIERLSGRDHWNVKWWETRDGVHTRRSQVVWGTRREAERRLAEIRVSLDETDRGSRQRLSRRITVGEAYERWWLPSARARLEEGRLARKTLSQMASTWRRRVSRWRDVPCRDVRPADIQAWLDPMTQKPAQDALAMLRQILDFAVMYEVVDVNKARNAYTMPTAHASRMDGAYTLDELARIAEAARGSLAEPALLLMMFGSCRTGEALGPLLDECRLVRSHGIELVVVDVVRQVREAGRLGEDGDLKNGQSVRPVVIPPPWAARLWELVGQRRAAGDAFLVDDGHGRPVRQEVLRADWAAAVEAAGLPAKAPRAARRSWETYMRWTMGVSPDRVERMMGHALPGVTGTHYDKPNADMFVETVAEAFARRPFVAGEANADNK